MSLFTRKLALMKYLNCTVFLRSAKAFIALKQSRPKSLFCMQYIFVND